MCHRVRYREEYKAFSQKRRAVESNDSRYKFLSCRHINGEVIVLPAVVQIQLVNVDHMQNWTVNRFPTHMKALRLRKPIVLVNTQRMSGKTGGSSGGHSTPSVVRCESVAQRIIVRAECNPTSWVSGWDTGWRGGWVAHRFTASLTKQDHHPAPLTESLGVWHSCRPSERREAGKLWFDFIYRRERASNGKRGIICHVMKTAFRLLAPLCHYHTRERRPLRSYDLHSCASFHVCVCEYQFHACEDVR